MVAEAFFTEVTEPIRYAGPESTDPLAFKVYDKDRVVLGKRMEEHLRPGVCFWHSFAWPGLDMFGIGTLDRPWLAGTGDEMANARMKMAVAFEFFTKIGVPYYCFHDRDVAPESERFPEFRSNLDALVADAERYQDETGVRLLWGTANLFTHPRYQGGAATNPDPEVFAYAAAQVKHMMEITQRLGGQNYVLWGGREGYETLLNTRVDQELDQLGRFLNMVVEHKHKIGFKGAILIEPKPREPVKHQYDFDVASVYGFLVRYGLEKEVKVNIEANHATLAGHSFEHEIATAASLGILGSLDMNRGDPQLGWDTDQFPHNVPETALALYHVLRAGGLGSGGLNFDAKVRRQSIDPMDLFHGHIGGMDVCARGLVLAEQMILDGQLEQALKARYAGWEAAPGQDILAGKVSLGALADQVLAKNADTQPVSGRQEYLENLVNRFFGA